MILPNMPRLIRTGDQLTVTATVANQSEITGDAVIVLKLKDHLSGKDLQSWIGSSMEQTVRIDSRQQKSVSGKSRYQMEVLPLWSIPFL